MSAAAFLKWCAAFAVPRFTKNSTGGVVGFAGSDGGVISLNPAGSTVCAAFGDSITAQTTNVTAAQRYMYSNGYMTWSTALSLGKLYYSPELNFGVAGDTTTMMLARLSAAVASASAQKAKYVVILAGTNDIYGGVTHAQTISNLAAIYGQFYGAGITPVIVPILPRAKDAASGSMLTADRQKLQRINNWIRNYCRDNAGFVLADPTLNIADYSLTNGDPIGALTANSTAYTYDGLHPANRAAYWIGKAIADALAYRLVGASMSIWSPIDTHDITNNPTGNLLANGFMAGTSGTNGTGSSGSVATSFTARRLSGTNATIVASKGTASNENGTTYEKQRLVCAGAGAGSATEALQIYQQIFIGAGTYAVGDTVYAECAVDVSGITANTFKTVYLQCQDSNMNARSGHQSGAGYMPNVGFSGVLRTPSFVVQAGSTAITTAITVELDGTAACGVTIDVSRMTLRKA